MITTIVTAMFIAVFTCIAVAILLMRAERKQEYKPWRPEPDTGDDEVLAMVATMTAPRQQHTARPTMALQPTPTDTTLVTLAAQVERIGLIVSNHSQRLIEQEDMIALHDTMLTDLANDLDIMHADVVREIVKWRVEAEDGRLDLML